MHVFLLHMTDMMLLGFACNVNHVIMMSVAFTFHLCCIGMRCHDVIGVHSDVIMDHFALA